MTLERLTDWIPGKIRHVGAANHRQQYALEALSTCFPRGGSPTDIDGVYFLGKAIEIGSRFLFFEFKSTDSAPTMPTGQKIFYNRLLKKLGRGSALFMVAHHPSHLSVVDLSLVHSLIVVSPFKGRIVATKPVACDMTALRSWCSSWINPAQFQPLFESFL